MSRFHSRSIQVSQSLIIGHTKTFRFLAIVENGEYCGYESSMYKYLKYNLSRAYACDEIFYYDEKKLPY